MVCPKCRKIYPEGVEICPECDSQLIALMGEADAPTDKRNDKILNLDVIYASDAPDSYDQDITSYQTIDEEPYDEDDVEEVEYEQEEDGNSDYFEDYEYESDENESYEQDYAEDDYIEDEPEEDVKIFISSADKSFSQQQDSGDEVYGEDYEIEFDDDGDYGYDSEETYDEYDDSDYDEDEDFREETTVGSAVVYKKQKKGRRTADAHQISESNNVLTILIFAVAVLMVIVSVICFVLGSSTELTEMKLVNMFFESLLYLR